MSMVIGLNDKLWTKLYYTYDEENVDSLSDDRVERLSIYWQELWKGRVACYMMLVVGHLQKQYNWISTLRIGTHWFKKFVFLC